MGAISNFFGNLVAREKAAADLFRQAYGAYQAGEVQHDPQGFTAALGNLQNDWQQMRKPQPQPAPEIQRGVIAAAMPAGGK